MSENSMRRRIDDSGFLFIFKNWGVLISIATLIGAAAIAYNKIISMESQICILQGNTPIVDKRLNSLEIKFDYIATSLDDIKKDLRRR